MASKCEMADVVFRVEWRCINSMTRSYTTVPLTASIDVQDVREHFACDWTTVYVRRSSHFKKAVAFPDD